MHVMLPSHVINQSGLPSVPKTYTSCQVEIDKHLCRRNASLSVQLSPLVDVHTYVANRMNTQYIRMS